MSAPLRITLTPEETITLQDLRVAPKVAQRTKDRAQVLLANANGCNTPAIAQFMGCQEHTVREAIRRWRVFGLRGLWDAERSGLKPRWTEEDMQHLEKCLEEEDRTYNSHQLAQKLVQERHVRLSANQIRKVLKKRAGDGKERDISQKRKQNLIEKELKALQIKKLELMMQAGYVNLKYLDEAGFSAWSEVSYSYSRIGEQKRLEQPKKRGKRQSIIGLLGEGKSFEYGLIEGNFNSETYIRFMDKVAEQAAREFKETDRVTVIIQDNSSVHRSKLSQAQMAQNGVMAVFHTSVLFRAKCYRGRMASNQGTRDMWSDV